MTPPKAFACGCANDVLSDDEKRFLSAERPWGVILFARNCLSPNGVAELVRSIRELDGLDDVAILIDQEGGRVQRLCPPHWRRHPSPSTFGATYRRDSRLGIEEASRVAASIADDLVALGIDVNCAPTLDVPVSGASDVIGDRAFSDDPEAVAALGRAWIDVMRVRGVVSVMKHVPGHGRARVDSHESLPTVSESLEVLERSDFAPFRSLSSFSSAAMTAHVVYEAIDPTLPMTLSAKGVSAIRKRIGFEGLLLTDDVSMGALSGSMEARSSAAFSAGCDIVLHCNGDLDEAREVASSSPRLDGKSLERVESVRIAA